jgi:hypothetical protein
MSLATEVDRIKREIERACWGDGIIPIPNDRISYNLSTFGQEYPVIYEDNPSIPSATATTTTIELKAMVDSTPYATNVSQALNKNRLERRGLHITHPTLPKKPSLVKSKRILKELGATWGELRNQSISWIRENAWLELPITVSINVSARYTIHGGALYTQEWCRKEAEWLACRARQPATSWTIGVPTDYRPIFTTPYGPADRLQSVQPIPVRPNINTTRYLTEYYMPQIQAAMSTNLISRVTTV